MIDVVQLGPTKEAKEIADNAPPPTVVLGCHASHQAESQTHLVSIAVSNEPGEAHGGPPHPPPSAPPGARARSAATMMKLSIPLKR